MPSAWALKSEERARKAASLSFLKEKARTALGTAFNEYSWREAAKGAGAKLPDSNVVHHCHPIAFLLELAYSA